MRLIDTDAIKLPEGFFEKVDNVPKFYDWLNSLPTIDAVEIVRCKDCTNFTQGKDEWGSCFENPLKMWRDTYYCSWGERKEQNEIHKR